MKTFWLNIKYRGFRIGWTQRRHGISPVYISSFETEPHVCSILVDAVEEVEATARSCIDYQYRIDATEACLGRRLTIDEMTPDL